jgi:two-component system chemotaxis sensor kinase CheA
VALDLSKYLSLFVAEAGEHLAAFAKDVVRLERAAPDGADRKEAVDALFRHAHSVKGMAASMTLDGISALAHATEDLADVFRKDPARADAAAADLLLAAGDALAGMVQAAAAGATPPPDAALVERLVEAARRRPDRAPAVDEPAATRPAPPADEPVRPPAARPEPPRPEAAPRAVRRVEAQVDIAGTCPVPAVRAFLVVKKLSSLGTVLSSAPTAEELRAGRIPGKKLVVSLETAESLQSVERALAQISDIAGVVLRAADVAPPPAAAPAPAPVPKADPEAARTVRVRTEILDGFLDAVGELILATARIREIGKTLPAPSRGPLDEGVDRLHAIVKDLHDKVMAVRMTPLALVTERLPRAARDVARKLGRQVDVEVRGAEIELDRAILEELADPFMHVLRNAVDHGVEAPHLRLLAGKPATGRITVHARRERDRVIVEIGDDGKGMDPARLRAAAVARGTHTAEQAAALGDREALLLATLPGLSTAETVTDVSGRGVGLDAVKRAVEALGGALELESTPGRGSKVVFRLPLTVAVQPVLLVRVGEEILGLPIAKVHGAAQVALSRLDRTRGAPVLPYDGELVPVYDLTRLLGIPGSGRDERAVVVAEGAEGRIGLAVDALLGQQEAVLKPLSQPLDAVPGLSAVTVLGSGRPVFILDVPRLLAA